MKKNLICPLFNWRKGDFVAGCARFLKDIFGAATSFVLMEWDTLENKKLF